MATLDPRLQYIIDDAGQNAGGDAESAERFGIEAAEGVPGLDAPGEPRIRLLLQFEGTLNEALALGFVPTSIAGDVASGTMPLSACAQLEHATSIRVAEGARQLHSELDVSVRLVGADARHSANPANRGRNVIVGIIDTGIDFRHEAFRDDAGNSRILAIWDQRLRPEEDGESSPQPFDYGVEYTKDQIDAALAGNGTVRHRDTHKTGHGTHVAGIAAGNGLAAPASTFVGVAPEADIIVVSNLGGSVGDSTAIVDAVEYLVKKASTLGKPIAINLSQGDNLGAHDGTTLLERAIDNLIVGPGVAMVKSAGNSRADSAHASDRITAPGKVIEFRFIVPEDDNTPDTFDIWYSGDDRIEIEIVPPTGGSSGFLSDSTTHQRFPLANGNAAFVGSVLRDPFNDDNHLTVVVDRGTKSAIVEGEWKLRLRGTAITNGRVHVWIERAGVSPQFTGSNIDEKVTITTPAAARRIIAVGSFICKNGDGPNDDLSRFSSIGPTRDNRRKPDLAAPGENVMSARKNSSGLPERYVLSRGTSMAAPHATGAIALLLEREPQLDAAQIASRLKAACKRDSFTTTRANARWGAGKLQAV